MTKRKDIWQVLPGDPTKPGISRTATGFNFTIHVPSGQAASLLIYKKGSPALVSEIPLPEGARIGEVSAIRLEPLEADKWEYNYRIDGVVCQDPYATGLVGREKFGAPMPAKTEEHALRCRMMETPVVATPALQISYADSVIYKLHVRGFTKSTGAKVRKKGTFAGVIEKIPYLVDLHVTAVELMPAYEFFELPAPSQMMMDYRQDPTQPVRINYWGYGPALYFAPKAAYAAGHAPQEEFAEMVDALHRAGIECIMEFYFPKHTDAQLVLDVLHYWQLTYHIDGFHLLGDGDVWFEFVARDTLLKKTKLSYLGFDPTRIYGDDRRPYYRNLAEHNLAFEQEMRKFLKGDEGCLESAAYRMRRNPKANAVINFFADHDGYTMYDMVSYEQKHNLDNGEDNADGSNLNYTWHCGIEGPTRKSGIKKIRTRQLRNAWLMLLCAQGTPMIRGGDEICDSAAGNNNPYCQDNAIGWLDWNMSKYNQEMLDFVRQAIAFRRNHPVLHQSGEPKMMDYKSYGCPDLSYHGERAWYTQMEYNCRYIGVMYCGEYATHPDGSKDNYLFFAFNMHWESHEIALPSLPRHQVWHIAANTDSPEGFYEAGQEPLLETQRSIEVPPRSIYILIGKQE